MGIEEPTLGYLLALVDLGHFFVKQLVSPLTDGQDLLPVDAPACLEISNAACWQRRVTCP